MSRTGQIYITKNKLNGKCYVGQTVQPSYKKRLNRHKRHKTSLLGKAIRKYGIENFATIVEENIPEEFLDFIEVSMIYSCDGLAPNGYNLDTGGSAHKHASEETRHKLSIASSGESNPCFGRTGDKNPMFSKPGTMRGKSFSSETRKKMSGPRRPNTEEHNRKIATSRLGKHYPRKVKEGIF